MRQREKWRRMLTSFTTQRNCNLIVFRELGTVAAARIKHHATQQYAQVTETLNTVGNWHVIYQNWHIQCMYDGGAQAAEAAPRAAPRSLQASTRLHVHTALGKFFA